MKLSTRSEPHDPIQLEKEPSKLWGRNLLEDPIGAIEYAAKTAGRAAPANGES